MAPDVRSSAIRGIYELAYMGGLIIWATNQKKKIKKETK